MAAMSNVPSSTFQTVASPTVVNKMIGSSPDSVTALAQNATQDQATAAAGSSFAATLSPMAAPVVATSTTGTSSYPSLTTITTLTGPPQATSPAFNINTYSLFKSVAIPVIA
ncbi:MAG: hypothetical protein Q9190_007707 [Brigantiaea leucoxantha]